MLCYQMKVNVSEKSILEHESFHESLLNMEKWLMIMRQRLESFRRPNGEWSIGNRQHEAQVTHSVRIVLVMMSLVMNRHPIMCVISLRLLQKALGEFPDKEIQLQRTDAQGHAVLLKTSEEGKVHIQRDLKRLRESWVSLHELSLNVYR